MKKHHSYWVFLFALLLSGSLHAKVDNYVGAYANLGEWSLLPANSKYGASYGIAGGAGFLYELQAGPKYSQTQFLFDVGVGATGGMTAFLQGSSFETVLKEQQDFDGDWFDYVYEVKDRHDQYRDLAVQIPILFGVQYRKFYAMAGVKVYSHVLTKFYTTANITTFGRSVEFGELRDNPKWQFFEEKPMEPKKDKTTLQLDLDLSVEIGGRIGYIPDEVGFDVPRRKIEYRLAGFLDYGLLDVHKAGNNSGLTTPAKYDANPNSKDYVYDNTNMLDGLKMNDIMSTTDFASKVSNLVVGLKFTVLFQMPSQGQCVICKDGYRSLARRRGSGRRGMQYEE